MAIRRGVHTGMTAGLVPGAVQGNVVVLPRDFAEDFHRFCHLNPKPCPLLTLSQPGDFLLDELGDDIDIRTDVPAYRVYRDGKLAQEVNDIRSLWRSDMVTFVLGCSFSFEEALVDAGVGLRHLELGIDVAMYRTNIQTIASGPFSGPMVVSMRPLTVPNTIRAIQITSRYPRVHGAPVHFGDPLQIGIMDIDKPDWGAPAPFEPNEIPVFWACGVTPQTVVEQARIPICITHKPSHMLVTDRKNTEYATF